jgi:hypothetical protein
LGFGLGAHFGLGGGHFGFGLGSLGETHLSALPRLMQYPRFFILCPINHTLNTKINITTLGTTKTAPLISSPIKMHNNQKEVVANIPYTECGINS